MLLNLARVRTLILLLFAFGSKAQRFQTFGDITLTSIVTSTDVQVITRTFGGGVTQYNTVTQTIRQYITHTQTIPQYITQTQTIPQYITLTQTQYQTIITTQTVHQFITQTLTSRVVVTIPQYITETQFSTQLHTQYLTDIRTRYITSTVTKDNTITKTIPNYITRTLTLPCNEQQQQQCTTPGTTKLTERPGGVKFPTQDIDIPKGACGQSTTPKIDERIAGGQKSIEGQFPWMVLLSFFSEFHERILYCGASLVSRQWIISAAHCFRHLKPNVNVHVYIGYVDKTKTQNGSDLFAITNKNIIIHDKFDTTTLENDIALARLPQKVNLGSAVQIICLATDGQIPFGAKAYAAGWGLLDSGDSETPNLLHDVELDVLEEETCTNPRHFICTYTPGKDTCQGDSGGPLMVLDQGRWYQVGIISSGPKDCGQHTSPGVYTRLPKYLNFITSWIYE